MFVFSGRSLFAPLLLSFNIDFFFLFALATFFLRLSLMLLAPFLASFLTLLLFLLAPCRRGFSPRDTPSVLRPAPMDLYVPPVRSYQKAYDQDDHKNGRYRISGIPTS